MNPVYHFNRMYELLEEFEPSPERDQARIRLQECDYWLGKCTPTKEALERDMKAA